MSCVFICVFVFVCECFCCLMRACVLFVMYCVMLYVFFVSVCCRCSCDVLLKVCLCALLVMYGVMLYGMRLCFCDCTCDVLDV